MRSLSRKALEREARLVPAARRLRFRMTAAALERFGDDNAHLKVLDAGCGEGLLAERLARRHPGWHVLGVDLDEDRLEVARRRLRGSGLSNLQFKQADLTSLGGFVGDFDAVLAIECLVEIEDDDRALASMAGVLRPGGLFVTHVPEQDWTPVLAASERTWRHEVRHGYGAHELASKLEEVGLAVTEIRPCSHALVRLAQELRDRTRSRSLKVALLVHLTALAAVELEQRGFRRGTARALFVQARRS